MRSKLFLILAMVMGLVTTYLFFSYMKQFDTEAVAIESMTEVVVAKQLIKKNQRITEAMLEQKKVPQQAIHLQSVRNIADVKDKYATSNIESGEMILAHRLGHQKEESLFVSRKVGEGNRAVSIGVNFVQTVSNLIEPEDMVDVVFSEQTKSEEKDQVTTKILLSKVRVLAVGRRMVEVNEGEPHAEYSSVTLELKPEDAVSIVNSSQKGTIQLVLHSRVTDSKEE
jgi:pilus assembly protein CpaB